MSAARETSNKATVRRLADAINSGDAELVSKTIEEIFDPEVKAPPGQLPGRRFWLY